MAGGGRRILTQRRPEEVRAALVELESREGQSNVRICPATRRNDEVVLKYWDEYAVIFGEVDLSPTLLNLKGFFDNMVAQQGGLIGERLSINTIENYAWRLKGCIERRLSKTLPEEDFKKLIEWFRNDLKFTYKLSDKNRQKPNMACHDLEEYLFFWWAISDRNLKFERTRLQVAAYMLLVSYTTSRPGCVIISDMYRKSEECLKYKDLRFCLARDSKGGPPIKVVEVDFNLMKGKRFTESDSGHVQHTITEDREQPHLCLVSLLFGMALADGAFHDAEGVLKFCDTTVPVQYLHLPLNPTIETKPVFRSALLSYTSDKGWAYAGLHHQLIALGHALGYEKPATSYAIRRECANLLWQKNKTLHASKILGHKASVAAKFHLQPMAQIDVQATFKQKSSQFNDFKPSGLKVTMRRHAPPPKQLSESEKKVALNVPQYLQASRRLAEATIEAQKTALRRELKAVRRSLLYRSLKELQEKHFRSTALEFETVPQTTDVPTNLAPCRQKIVDLLYKPSRQSSEMLPATRRCLLIDAYRHACLQKIKPSRSRLLSRGTATRERCRLVSRSAAAREEVMEGMGVWEGTTKTCMAVTPSHTGVTVPVAEIERLQNTCPNLTITAIESSQDIRSDDIPMMDPSVEDETNVPGLNICPYVECAKHFEGLRSMHEVMQHMVASHPKTKLSVCVERKCDAHEGLKAIRLFSILHHDFMYLMSKEVKHRSRLVAEYSPPEIV